jgi:hypothetical protein
MPKISDAQMFKWYGGEEGELSAVEMDGPNDSDPETVDLVESEGVGVAHAGSSGGIASSDATGPSGRSETNTSSAIPGFSGSAGSGASPPPPPPQNNDPPIVVDTSKKRIYPSDFDGRFIVYIREWKKTLPHITISRYLCNKYTTTIIQIVKVHKQKIRVECSNAFTANLLVADEVLNKEYRVSIPADVVEINGVISISNDFNILDLVNFGAGIFGNPSIPSVEIVDAYRMRRSVLQNGKTVVIDSDMVRVTFKGRALPKMVIIFGLRVPVRLYKPKLMFCDKCQGFNHTSKFCTSPLKCGKCRELHDTASCPQGPKCPLCLKDVIHQKREDCPVIKERTTKLREQVKIRSKIAYSKLIESKTSAGSVPLENQFSFLTDHSDEDEEIPEGASYSSVLKGKRRRPPAQKSNPPKRRASDQESAKPSTSKASTSTSESKQSRHKKNKKNTKPSEDHAEFKEIFDYLRASILEFVESLEMPPFWTKIASGIVSRVLDFLLPKISPLLSFLIPQPHDG